MLLTWLAAKNDCLIHVFLFCNSICAVRPLVVVFKSFGTYEKKTMNRCFNSSAIRSITKFLFKTYWCLTYEHFNPNLLFWLIWNRYPWLLWFDCTRFLRSRLALTGPRDSFQTPPPLPKKNQYAVHLLSAL